MMRLSNFDAKKEMIQKAKKVSFTSLEPAVFEVEMYDRISSPVSRLSFQETVELMMFRAQMKAQNKSN